VLERPKRPQLGDGLGRASKNFKRAVTRRAKIEVSPGAKDKKGELGDDAGAVLQAFEVAIPSQPRAQREGFGRGPTVEV